MRSCLQVQSLSNLEEFIGVEQSIRPTVFNQAVCLIIKPPLTKEYAGLFHAENC